MGCSDPKYQTLTLYPWVMICVDLVDPFTIRTTAKTTLFTNILALTMIDPATGWFEIVKATNKSATSIQHLFHDTWLARYPRPQFIVLDNGNMDEFKLEFKPITSHNHSCTSKCNH
jgi:hypothetical protein